MSEQLEIAKGGAGVGTWSALHMHIPATLQLCGASTLAVLGAAVVCEQYVQRCTAWGVLMLPCLCLPCLLCRGTPMRSPSGLSPEPSAASAPAAASPLPPPAEPAEPAVDQNKAALSAFDAFDELVTRRPSLSPRAGGTSA